VLRRQAGLLQMQRTTQGGILCYARRHRGGRRVRYYRRKAYGPTISLTVNFLAPASITVEASITWANVRVAESRMPLNLAESAGIVTSIALAAQSQPQREAKSNTPVATLTGYSKASPSGSFSFSQRLAASLANICR
jgi:hypothetical protein